MREIVSHHDGHGLNDDIVIQADLPDPKAGGASHFYHCLCPNWGSGAQIQFQHGPRNEEGAISGITEAVLYAILLDRLRAFQAGPFPCEENAEQIEHLEAAIALTKKRADKRAARGVLGKNLK